MLKCIFNEFKRMYSCSDLSILEKILYTILGLVVMPGWVYLWACSPDVGKNEVMKLFMLVAYSLILWAFIGLAFV